MAGENAQTAADVRDLAGSRPPDWQAIGTIAGAAVTLGGIFATLLANLFPGVAETFAKQIAYAGAVACVAAVGGWYLYRQRAKTKDMVLLPISEKAALRNLLPFNEGDSLLGRDAEITELLALAENLEFHFGTLLGESGSGKTSLLRAGLIPALRRAGHLPIYVPRVGSDPVGHLLAVLRRDFAREGVETMARQGCLGDALKEDVPDSRKSVVIVFDQFEEFLLAGRKDNLLPEFKAWLTRNVVDGARRCFILVAIREEYFARLQSLSPAVPEPTSMRQTYPLLNLTATDGLTVLTRSLKSDGQDVPGELAAAVIHDLERDGYVRPSELQIVGTYLKRRRILTLDAYKAADRAPGILGTYIKGEIGRCSDPKIGSLLLRQMCDPNGLTKAVLNLSVSDLVAGAIGAGSAASQDRLELVARILQQFMDARIVNADDDGALNLVHDYLAPLVLRATDGIESGREQADRLLRRYLAEYRLDRRIVIPRHLLRLVDKLSDPGLRLQEDAAGLIRKSKVVAMLRWVVPAIATLLLIGLPYLLAFNHYYLTIGTPRFAGGSPPIEVRSGHPYLRFLPGLGRVIAETDADLRDVRDGSDAPAVALQRGDLSDWTGQDGGYRRWQSHLNALLAPPSAARSRSLLGDRGGAFSTLTVMARDIRQVCGVGEQLYLMRLRQVPTYTRDLEWALLGNWRDGSATIRSKACAAFALGTAYGPGSGHSAQAQTLMRTLARLLAAKVDFMSAENMFKQKIPSGLLALAEANDGAVPADVVALLEGALAPNAVESFSDRTVVRALVDLAAISPAVARPGVLGKIELRQDMLAGMLSLAMLHPEIVTEEALSSLAAKAVTGDEVSAAALIALLHLGVRKYPRIVASLVAELRHSAGSTDEDTRNTARIGEAALLAISSPAEARPGLEVARQSVRAVRSEDSDTYSSDALAAYVLLAFAPLNSLDLQNKQRLIESVVEAVRNKAVGSLDYLGQDNLAPLVALFARRYPAAITPHLIDLMVDGIEHSHYAGHDMDLAITLAAIAQTQPQAVLDKVFPLVGHKFESRSEAAIDSRRWIIEATLARARYTRALKKQGEAAAGSMIAALGSPRRTDRRDAAFGLFFLMLDNPEKIAWVRESVGPLVGSIEPEARIAASHVLELATIAEWTSQAATKPVVRASVLTRLRLIEGFEIDDIATTAAKLAIVEIDVNDALANPGFE